jgi:hypothetical protein
VGDRVRLAFDYAGGRFEGHGKIVRIPPFGSPIVRPDGWDHDLWPAALEIDPDYQMRK